MALIIDMTLLDDLNKLKDYIKVKNLFSKLPEKIELVVLMEDPSIIKITDEEMYNYLQIKTLISRVEVSSTAGAYDLMTHTMGPFPKELRF